MITKGDDRSRPVTPNAGGSPSVKRRPDGGVSCIDGPGSTAPTARLAVVSFASCVATSHLLRQPARQRHVFRVGGGLSLGQGPQIGPNIWAVSDARGHLTGKGDLT